RKMERSNPHLDLISGGNCRGTEAYGAGFAEPTDQNAELARRTDGARAQPRERGPERGKSQVSDHPRLPRSERYVLRSNPPTRARRGHQRAEDRHAEGTSALGVALSGVVARGVPDRSARRTKPEDANSTSKERLPRRRRS